MPIAAEGPRPENARATTSVPKVVALAAPTADTKPIQDRNQIRGSSSVYIGKRCEDEGSESTCTDGHCRHACCEYRGDVEVNGERYEYGIEDADA